MKNFFKLFILYLILILLNWWILKHLSFYGFVPNLMLVTTLVVAVLCKDITGYIFGFFCGLFIDFMGSYLFGGYGLCFTLSVYLIIVLRNRLDFDSLITQILVVLGLTLFVKIFYGFLGFVFIGKFVFANPRYFIITACLNGLISPFIFAVAGKFLLGTR